jgi:uncharacterized protein
MKILGEHGDATAAAASAEVEMQIRGLMIDPVTNTPIVVLKDVASDTVLPIWVGIFEANAIALELEKTTTPRPMTHDLLRNLARGLNAVVRKVVVSELRDDTFYAVIWMEQEGETVTLDARPSDAIALALRWDCPIYASRAVLDNAKQVAEGPPNANTEEMRRWLENLNDDEMGRYKM